jgi:hypothetical protein
LNDIAASTAVDSFFAALTTDRIDAEQTIKFIRLAISGQQVIVACADQVFDTSDRRRRR